MGSHYDSQYVAQATASCRLIAVRCFAGPLRDACLSVRTVSRYEQLAAPTPQNRWLAGRSAAFKARRTTWGRVSFFRTQKWSSARSS
jgi:hypothetical protein